MVAVMISEGVIMRRNHPASAARAPCDFRIPAWVPLVVLLFFLPLFSTVAEAGAPWFFLPTFMHQITGLQQIAAKDITAGATPSVISAFVARTPELTEEGKKLLVWRTATFPHQDFVRLMPKNNVFGWYAHVFDRPPELEGFDLLLDLGVIDDADETFLNGTLIGKTGKVPGGSAWNTDRLYRIPADLVAEKGNVLTSHVWSLWGLGGIVGPPMLKAALVPADAQWELAFIKDEKAPTAGLNHAESVDKALSLCLGENMPGWQKAAIPWTGWKNWPDDAHFAVFRTTLKLPENNDKAAHFHSPAVLDIGPVFDVAAVFLNGKRIGLTGRFPEDGEPAFTEAARRGQYMVAPQDWNIHGDNRLTVVIYRERGIGGLPGVPGILLENPIKPLRYNPSVAECFTSFDILHQSQMYGKAGHSLDEARPDNDLDQVWLLSHRAHLAWLRWLDGERGEAVLDNVLKPIHEILTKYPVESPKQSAMQAFCRILRMAEKDEALLAKVRHYFPDFSKDCRYLEPDRLTKGDWQMHYGNRFYVLAAMGQIRDWQAGTRRPRLPYTLGIPGDKDKARLWLANNLRSLSHPAALLMHDDYKRALAAKNTLGMAEAAGHLLPAEKVRRAAWWDDHGEMHPFDDQGPDLLVTVALPPGWQQLSFYLLDYDWRLTRHPRQQSFIVFDESGSVLNAAWNGKSDTGAYERFFLHGNKKIRTRFIKHRGACVAVNGFFVDLAPELPELPKTLSGKVVEEYKIWYDELRSAKAIESLALGDAYMTGKDALLSVDADELGAFLWIAGAEASFGTHAAAKQLPPWLSANNSLESLNRLLASINQIGERHLRWHYIIVARMLELMQKEEPENIRKELTALIRNCGEYALYPLRGIIANYLKEYEFSTEDPLYVAIQRSLPEKMDSRPVKPVKLPGEVKQ